MVNAEQQAHIESGTPGDSTQSGDVPMDRAELEKRGSDLYKEIEDNYKMLLKDVVPNGEGADMSPIIEKFIPEGTSFEDVAVIFSKAGFELSLPPLRIHEKLLPFYKEEDRFNIYGSMKLSSTIGTNILITVTVIPNSPGLPHPKVKNIRAAIFYKTL